MIKTFVNHAKQTQVVLSNGRIINMPSSGYPCHFWSDEDVTIVDTGNKVVVDGIEFERVYKKQ